MAAGTHTVCSAAPGMLATTFHVLPSHILLSCCQQLSSTVLHAGPAALQPPWRAVAVSAPATSRAQHTASCPISWTAPVLAHPPDTPCAHVCARPPRVLLPLCWRGAVQQAHQWAAGHGHSHTAGRGLRGSTGLPLHGTTLTGRMVRPALRGQHMTWLWCFRACQTQTLKPDQAGRCSAMASCWHQPPAAQART